MRYLASAALMMVLIATPALATPGWNGEPPLDDACRQAKIDEQMRAKLYSDIVGYDCTPVRKAAGICGGAAPPVQWEPTPRNMDYECSVHAPTNIDNATRRVQPDYSDERTNARRQRGDDGAQDETPSVRRRRP